MASSALSLASASHYLCLHAFLISLCKLTLNFYCHYYESTLLNATFISCMLFINLIVEENTIIFKRLRKRREKRKQHANGWMSRTEPNFYFLIIIKTKLKTIIKELKTISYNKKIFVFQCPSPVNILKTPNVCNFFTCFQVHLNDKLICFILLLQSCQQILAHPLAHPELNEEFPVAYNLHQEFTPRDINDLGHEQKTKALYDVRTTISEVEKLLALDPNLPRLTRFDF